MGILNDLFLKLDEAERGTSIPMEFVDRLATTAIARLVAEVKEKTPQVECGHEACQSSVHMAVLALTLTMAQGAIVSRLLDERDEDLGEGDHPTLANEVYELLPLITNRDNWRRGKDAQQAMAAATASRGDQLSRFIESLRPAFEGSAPILDVKGNVASLPSELGTMLASLLASGKARRVGDGLMGGFALKFDEESMKGAPPEIAAVAQRLREAKSAGNPPSMDDVSKLIGWLLTQRSGQVEI